MSPLPPLPPTAGHADTVLLEALAAARTAGDSGLHWLLESWRRELRTHPPLEVIHGRSARELIEAASRAWSACAEVRSQPRPTLSPPAPHWLLDVFVPGHPRPQGSIKAIVHKHTGRAVAIKDNNLSQKSWRADVRFAVERHWAGAPLDGPIRARCDFVMPRPQSTPKKRTPPATKKPDGDKLLRAVWDALTDVVWVDDSRIVSWSGSKRLAEIGETPGCRIRVAEVLRDPDAWGMPAEPALPAEQPRLWGEQSP